MEKNRIRKLNTRSLLGKTRERTASETARELALKIQRRIPFLPAEERSDVRIFACLHPGTEMGGDFYRAFFLDDNHLAVLMGDVAGKGIETALYMSTLATMLWDLALEHLEPSEILNRANHRLSLTGENGVFAAVWVGILNTGTGELLYAEAGHGSLILRRGNGPYEEVISRRNPVLGALDTGFYRESSLRMNPGDRILLYSGGLFSITNEEGSRYGKMRLFETLNGVSGTGGKDLSPEDPAYENRPSKGRESSERKSTGRESSERKFTGTKVLTVTGTDSPVEAIRVLEADYKDFLGSTKPTDDYSFLVLDYLSEHRTDLETTIRTKEDVDSFGGVHLGATTGDLLKRGFRYKDLVTVRLDGRFLELPLVPNFRYLRPGESALLAWPEEEKELLIMTFCGNFAESFGLKEMKEFPLPVRIRLKEAGGYEKEYRNRDLVRSDRREEYPHLTDEEFANCREVSFGKIGRGKLFRGSSPVNPVYGRSGISDAFLRKNGVKTVLNLTDRPDQLVKLPGYPGSYTSGIRVLCSGIDTDFGSVKTRKALKDAFSGLAGSEPPFFVHCLEGQDRTGYVIAVLEALMGASGTEIIADYMKTFYNYYGVEPGTLRYNALFANIQNSLTEAFGVSSLRTSRLPEKAASYLRGLGLSAEEVRRLREKLSEPAAGNEPSRTHRPRETENAPENSGTTNIKPTQNRNIFIYP